MIAESRAIREALVYCSNHGWENIEVETDSLSLRNILNNLWKIPWEFLEIVKDILRLMQSKDIQFKHVYREENHLADFITNITIDIESKQVFNTFNQLPCLARRLLNMDKYKISARLRLRSNSKNN